MIFDISKMLKHQELTLSNPLLVISIVCLVDPSFVSIFLISMETRSNISLISNLASAYSLNTLTEIARIFEGGTQ